MQISEMPAREARMIESPTLNLLVEVVDHIIGLGWKWQVSSVCPPNVENSYTWGWWYNPDEERKPLPTGDAGNFHLKAWDTFKAYVAPGR